MTRFFTGKIAPSPTAYEYWVDLNENPYGGVIKYYDGSEWIYINEELVLKDEELTETITNILNQLKNKADKSTTLSGYGISDAYTKTQTDTKIKEQINNIVGTAPELLDTLYELALALNNDEDFAASVTTELGKKQPMIQIVDLSSLEVGKTGQLLPTEEFNKLKLAIENNSICIFEYYNGGISYISTAPRWSSGNYVDYYASVNSLNAPADSAYGLTALYLGIRYPDNDIQFGLQTIVIHRDKDESDFFLSGDGEYYLIPFNLTIDLDKIKLQDEEYIASFLESWFTIINPTEQRSFLVQKKISKTELIDGELEQIDDYFLGYGHVSIVIKSVEGEATLFIVITTLINAADGYYLYSYDINLNGYVVTENITKIDLDSKQDVLVSGTNIKTVQGQSLLGSGNITIPNATTSASGLMSNTDKAKVDKIITNGNGNQYLSNNGTYKTVEAGLQDAPSDGKTYGRKDGQWAEVQATVNKEDLEDLLSYGVEWDTTVSDPDLTRIGNPLLHKSLPIQSLLRGCIAIGSAIKYYLNPNDWSKKEDGTNAVLDGTDGSVRVHVPKFYGKSEIDGNKRRVRISTTLIDSSYTEIPEMLIDAYRATVDTTAGSTDVTAKMLSVVNTTTQFRGGNNSSTYDLYLGTDNFRTMLGKPRTNISRATARKYARNADSELLNYEYYKWVLYWLPVIEYATFNLQLNFNSQLTTDGYHQGGLGSGVSTIDGNCWNKIFGNNPITPCGYANNLGNFTGVKNIALPEYKFTPTLDTTMLNWANISNGTGTKGDTLNITNVTTANANLTNISYDRASGLVIYNVTGVTDAQSIIFYTNNATVTTATLDGEITVDWGNTASARYIRANFTGECNISISYVSGTSTEITFSNRNLSVARYRGFENIFGDVWTNLDGIIINSSSELHPNDTEADVYTTTNPDNYGDDEQALSKMTYTGREAGTESYIKEFDLGTKAEIIPIEVGNGAGSATYKCDYHLIATSKDFLRTLLVGGDAPRSSDAGVGCFHSSYSVGFVHSIVGFRTYSLI